MDKENKLENELKNKLEIDAKIIKTLPGIYFLAQFHYKNEEKQILVYLSGKIRIHKINVLVGDKVKILLDPYNMKIARIIYRYTENKNELNYKSKQRGKK
ncbi:MAG: translation initiation factor IF-1 [Candidatus Phytoplasma australasiaticum]|nr:translation initiation factor IF-1 [Candidatus Phytoplasma australasiaticum]